MKYKTQPFAHQFEAYNFVGDKNYFALLMQQGTGKTKTVIDIAVDRYLKGEIDAVMVIAPNHVHRQWAVEQIPQHCAVDYKAEAFSSTAGKGKKIAIYNIIHNKMPVLKWLCVNVEAFSYSSHLEEFRDYVKYNRVFIILDEATSVKNPTAKRTQNIIHGCLTDCKYRGKTLVYCTPLSVDRAILTGTPITNSPVDAWSMFEFLKPNYFDRSYYAFKAHFTIEQKMVIYQGNIMRTITTPLKDINKIKEMVKTSEGAIQAQVDYGISEDNIAYIRQHSDLSMPYKYLDELKSKMSEVSFFKNINDCFDLPPKVYKHVLVSLNDEQKKMYESLEKEYIAEYNGKTITVLNKITLYTRLSQLASGFMPFEDDETGKTEVKNIGSNPKTEALINEIDNGDYPCIVVTRFTAEAKYLYQELSTAFKDKSVGIFIGPMKKPNDPIGDFKSGKVDILIANERMISKGHNLQLSHTIYFFSSNYSLEDRDQTEDRISRYGQTEKCLITDFIADGTIDMKVYASIKMKRNLLDYFRNTKIEDDLCDTTDDMKEVFNV